VKRKRDGGYMKLKCPISLYEKNEKEAKKEQKCNGHHIMQLFPLIANNSEHNENREHRERRLRNS